MRLAASAMLLLAIASALAGGTGQRAVAAIAATMMFGPAVVLVRSFWNRDDDRAVLVLVLLALLVRLPFALAPPLWSNDAYRYVWDGRLIDRGVDPRGITPADPRLVADRSSHLWPHIDLRTIATVYPPLALGAFALSAAIDRDGVRGAKIVMEAGDVLAVVVLLLTLRRAGLPRGRAALFALHPLVLVSFAQDAHVEAYAVAGVVAAVTARRPACVWGLALGILTKLYPLALVPLVAVRDRVAAALTVAVVAIAYVPSIATGHAFGSLGNYLGTQRFNEALTAILGVRIAIVVFALTVVAAVVIRRRGASLAGTALLVTGAYLLCTPNVLPWYATVVPALAVTRPAPFSGRWGPAVIAIVVWSGTVALAYAVPWFVRAGSTIDVALRCIEYAPIAAGIVAVALRHGDGTPAARPLRSGAGPSGR